MSSAVEVKEQVNLPLGKCMELVLNGIQYRLFRAAITVTIISLAVAFLMVMLSQSIISRQVARAVDERTAPRRLFDKWVSILSAPITDADLMADLAALTGPADTEWREFKAWGKIDQDSRVQAMKDAAAGQINCLENFFDKLPEGRRKQFVGAATGAAIFAYLSEGDHLRQFQTRLAESDRKLPMSFEEFESLLKKWRQTAADRRAIIDGHRALLEPVKELLGDKPIVDALAAAGPKLQKDLQALGFRMSNEQLSQLRREAAMSVDTRKITDLLKVTLVKQMVADRNNIRLSEADTDVLFQQINSAAGAAWLATLSASKEFTAAASPLGIQALNFTPGPALTELTAPTRKDLERFIQANAERIRAVAKDRRERQELADIETTVSQAGGSGGFSNRTVWLIAVSFLVCVVGIANAMLMSVTERFREIATMKCLGATDNFIMVNFILESVMQGVAGGLVGAVLGFLLGSLRAWASYGNMAWQNFPMTWVLATAGVAMVVGVVVSALAAVYPAYVAARLAPMEAMRIE